MAAFNGTALAFWILARALQSLARHLLESPGLALEMQSLARHLLQWRHALVSLARHLLQWVRPRWPIRLLWLLQSSALLLILRGTAWPTYSRIRPLAPHSMPFKV